MDDRIQKLSGLLVGHGLRQAFGVTGSGASLNLISELEANGACYFSAINEASAALMAGAATASSGALSASISIKGPGLTNMLPGIASNYFETIPALSISEAYDDSVPGYRMHKRLDHPALLSTLVKGTITLDEAIGENTDGCFAKLMTVAASETPGPVHLELRSGTLGGANNTEDADPQDASGHDADQQAARQLMDKSNQPVVIVGSLSSRRGWAEFLQRLRVPVFTTVAAKGVLEEGLEHSAGVFTGAGNVLALEAELFDHCDLVIGLGLRNTEVLAPKDFPVPLIILDEIDAGLHRGYDADVTVISAQADAAADLLERISSKSWGSEEIQKLKDKMRAELLSVNWLPSLCFEQLNGHPGNHALVVDTGSFCTIGEHIWHAGPERPFLASSNGRYMGTSIPSAIGLSVSNRALPVVCAVGDGGMRMYPAEIKLAVAEQLPICFILMTDGLYGSVACAATPKGMSRNAVTINQPSWLHAVEAMGCDVRQARGLKDFENGLNSWDQKSPLFIEAVFDAEPYAAMTTDLRS